jgi:hypothetical protein
VKDPYSVLDIKSGFKIRGAGIKGTNDLGNIDVWNACFLGKRYEFLLAERLVILELSETLQNTMLRQPREDRR